MGFNGFSSFRRKAGASVSEEVYPGSKKVRDHMNLIQENAGDSAERFEKKFKQQVLRMFDTKKEGRVNFALLTQEEIADIHNFIAHAAKRVAAGAISSPAFHKEIQRRRPGKALDELAGVYTVGHDSMHSMMAYARTKGASLVPAYTKIADQHSLATYKDLEANLEEIYVVGFASLGEIEEKLRTIRETQGLTGEELVLAAMESREGDIEKTQGFVFPDPNYLRDNRWPEFVEIVRNLSRNIEQEEPDPNFGIHEFQRILEPLLQRLRTGSEV